MGWVWDEADSSKSNIVAGSAPPSIDTLQSWCQNGATHFKNIFAQKTKPAATKA